MFCVQRKAIEEKTEKNGWFCDQQVTHCNHGPSVDKRLHATERKLCTIYIDLINCLFPLLAPFEAACLK